MTILDNAMMATATTGTGQITLGLAVAGYQTFAQAGATNNQIISYGIIDTSNTWEVGEGTYVTNSSGNYFSRTTIAYSSSSGSAITLSGSAQVYLTMLQQDYDTFTPGNSINVGASIVVNATGFYDGNSTANTFSNSTIDIIANSTSQTVITPISFSVGNSTANSYGNSVFSGFTNSTANTQIGVGTLTLAGAGSNTGLTVGTSSITANGYTFLPNGLLLQWGIASAVNSTTHFWSYPVTFPTTFFSMTVTGTVQSANGAHPGTVTITPNTSGANLVTSNATSQTVYWMAVGH